MSIRALLLGSALLSLPALTQAIPRPAEDAAARADQYAENLNDADAFLREVRDTVELARQGEYGKIDAGDMDRLDAAKERISTLLSGHQHPRQLSTSERIELFNAQEEITAIVRNDDKSRRVCTRVKGTGTRIAKAECLTVAQREQRAKATRESTRFQQRYLDPNCEARGRSTGNNVSC